MRERRARRRGRMITTASMIAVTIMAVLGWFFYEEWQDGLMRESLALADTAQIEINAGHSVTSALLAVEGLRDTRKDSSFTAHDGARWLLRPKMPSTAPISPGYGMTFN